jgi:hypothetical protein
MDASDKIPPRIRKQVEAQRLAVRRRNQRLEAEAETLVRMGYDLSELLTVERRNDDGTFDYQVQPKSITE